MLTPALWILAIVLGFCRAWAGRNLMNPDGVSYIDVGEAYLRGDWNAAVNGYWSPFYPWLLGAGLKFLHPSAYWEFPVVHLINFFIYLAALAAFHFFWTSLIRYHAGRRDKYQELGAAAIPESVWMGLGYTVFLISSLELIGLEVVSPDMCVAAFVYLASGMILRIRTGKPARRMYFLLGVFLGFAYLAKPAMLPLSVLFIVAAISLPGTSVRDALIRSSIALLGLGLIATPYIVALSKHQGHPTYSEAGKLAYAWQINRVPYPHWAGQMPGLGNPVHTQKKIFGYPAAYEFSSSSPGTYPGWYDPAYWLEGVIPRINIHQQLVAFKTDGQVLFDLFFGRFQGGLVIGILALYLFSGNWRLAMRGVGQQWFLLVPPLTAFAMFWSIWVEPRYIGPFIGLFWAGMISGLRFPDMAQSRKLLTSITVAVASVTLLAVLESTASQVDLVGTAPPVQWQVADYLERTGVRPGDRVAAIGHVLQCGWARLARVRITAEIPHEAEWDFRTANDKLKADALAALFGTGVKVVVADFRQESGCGSGWRAVGQTGYYVCTAQGYGPPKPAV